MANSGQTARRSTPKILLPATLSWRSVAVGDRRQVPAILRLTPVERRHVTIAIRDRRSDTDQTEQTAYRPIQDGLRATGHYLDRSGMRLLSLIVVREGIALLVDDPHNHEAAQALLFTHDDLRPIDAAARQQRGRPTHLTCSDPLFMTGYEDFLRALGTVLSQDWYGFRLLRFGDAVVLRHGAPAQRRQIIMRRPDVHNLLNQAFRQRRRGATPGVPSIPAVAEPIPISPSAPAASAHASYEQYLEALGYHLDRSNASDILVAEIGGGIVMSYLSPGGGGQVVTTANHEQVARFGARSRRFHLPRRHPNQYRAKLRAVGRHLDARHATAAMIQETETGMLVGYVGPTRVYDDDWAEKERLAEHLSDLLGERVRFESW